MLLWLQQNLPDKQRFLTKLCGVSFLLHMVLCFFLFFFYQSYNPSITMNVRATKMNNDVIIRLLPLSGKRPTQKKLQSVTKPPKKASSTKNKLATRLVQKKKIGTKKATMLATVQSKKSKVDKVKVEALAVKKEKKIENRIKSKIETQKPIEKSPELQAVTNKPEDTKDLLEKKEDAVVPVVAQENVSQQVLPKASEVTEETQPQIVNEDNVRYVTYKELDALQLEQALELSIQQVWIAPVGIDPDVVSEVLVTVGWDGVLVEKQIIKPSNIIVYDVAVQEALEEITFPRQVWGKQIKIAFRP